MSYEIVRSVRYDRNENKVFIECASNNVRPLLFSQCVISDSDSLRQLFNALLDGDFQLLKTNGTKKVRTAFDAVREEEQKRYGRTLNQYAELTAILKMLDDEFSRKEVTDAWWLELKERFAYTDLNNLNDVMRIWWKLRDNGIFTLDDKWEMETIVKNNEINSLYELFKEKIL